MDLDSMKYAELRCLAKELGLKANMKVRARRDINNALKNENEAQEKSEDGQDSSCKEEVSNTAGFVNTRRGKRNGTKRKISDTATLTKGDAEIPPNAAKVLYITPHSTQITAMSVYRVALLQCQFAFWRFRLKYFKKLHEAHFNKMESIDSYVQRKTKQLETYRSSVKELKNLSDKTKLQQVDSKAQRANPTHASMFSPALVNKTPGGENRRHTLLSATKKPLAAKEEVPFRPSVLSTRRINVRFSEATRDNENKRSLVKTPARMSPCVTSSTPHKQTADGLKPSSVKIASFSATKTPGPFVFTGNTSISTPGTHKKPSFDLKASLSRPLNYKPHKGKLKPFGEVQENTAINKSVISNTHQETYKQHKVQSREDRRAKQTQNRKQKKENMLGARRGLIMT
uniref:Nucleolar and spindle associated protein 1 n=1 Tax=Amphilophus citrinellus TaxID=61819 RepID=A0A3Q0RZ08_AMPCI